MPNPITKIFDAATGETIEREMTDAEYADLQMRQADIKKEKEAEAEAEAKRSAALAKLEALGLDEDDLKALGL